MTPRVSVLIPAYDAEATLPAALASVARQTWSNFECVLVDDGSRDGTARIAREFSARDRRFRLISRAHTGIVGALEAGLRECCGDYVARMDADDAMRRTRLARQLAELERRPELSAVASHVRIFPRTGLSDGLLSYERWLASVVTADDVRREAFVECPVVHPTLMFRRDVLASFGYRNVDWPEDYDLVLRLLARGHRLAVVPERLVLWRDAPKRLSRSAPNCARDSIVRCKAHYLAEGPLARVDRYLLWGYGDTGRALCRALLRHGKRPSEIIELHPGRIGQRIAGARVVHPDELATLERRPLVVSVAGFSPRSQIRDALGRIGYREGADFVVAA